VKENIKKHDQLSFEVKLRFPANKKSGKTNDFNINMYLFLPYGLDVNKHNFTKEDFYNSLKTSIRLTTPFYKLNQLLVGEVNPFNTLQTAINSYFLIPSKKTFLEYEKQVKLFCSILKVALRHDVNNILKCRDKEEKLQLIETYNKNITNVRSYFTGLKERSDMQHANNKVLRTFQYADEYQSLLVEKQTAFVIKLLSKQRNDNGHLLNLLKKTIIGEMDYRLELKYPSVAIKNQTYAHLLHRTARLKKFIESNLYLNTDTKKEGVVVEQLLFSIAAGIAMVFATGVAFASQLLYGNLSLPFFIALVIGYMFKDRIKELVRIYFSKKHQKVFYDFKTKIYSQEKKKIGSLKESFSFIRHSHLPVEVLKIRNNIRATEITEESLGEKIINYRTKVIIRNKVKSSSDFMGISQILRFNISDFIRKMDDPEKEVLLRTKSGFKRIFSDRVYHINMILAYNYDNVRVLKPYKIYTSRKGIRKIERINSSSLV